MFEQTRDYDAVYVGKFPAYAEDAGPALKWAAQKAKELGSTLTIVAPTRKHFKDQLPELPPAVRQETPQTLGRYFPHPGPVVVSFWPGIEDLEQLDSAQELKALAVVPWLEEYIDTWRAARGANDLLGTRATPEAPTLSDPVVEAALRSVTRMINVSTGLANPRDRSTAIHSFKILRRNGHTIDPGEIPAWAMANGWGAEDARELGELARGVLAGRGYRAGASPFRSDIIRVWREKGFQEDSESSDDD
jgi:hypothetical protein